MLNLSPILLSNLPSSIIKTSTARMQIENNTIVMPKSAGSPLFMKESGPNGEAVKISGEKRPPPYYPINSPQHQCSTSNPGGGHLVYVRRKAEVELGRSPSCHNLSDRPDNPQVMKHGEHNETSQQKMEFKEPRNITAEVLSTCMDSSAGFLATKPSVSFPLPKSSNYSTLSNTTCHITSTNSLLADPKSVDVKHWHERYFHLQNFLKELDQSNQEDYIQMLWSLSSVELSRHAVELEKRCIQLSLEEGKELQRVGVLDVLGGYSKKS